MHKRILTVLAAALTALTVTAEFSYKAELTVSGYSGATTLNNFPVLVRLSPDRIDGFTYTRCQADGKDIQFTSPDGATVYPHEIDTWNPDGESLVWVNVPRLSGTETKFAFWFCDPTVTTPAAGKAAWAAANDGFYAGVWHFSEVATEETAMSVKCLDSAKHHTQSMDLTPLAMNPAGETEEKVSVEGVLGLGRQNGLRTSATLTGNGYRSGGRPTQWSDFTKGQFTFSTWLKINQFAIWTVVAGVKTETARTGWWLQINSAKVYTTYGDYVAGHTQGVSATFDDTTKVGWFHLTVTVDQKNVSYYTNGVFVTSGELGAAPTDDYNLFALGQGPYRFAGSFDESRLMSSIASADWIKAEYETASVDDYLTYGKAQKQVEDSFVITAEPEQLGTVVPAYGSVTELEDPIFCSAPDGDVEISADLRIAFNGWKLYRADDDGNWQLVDSAVTNRLLYVHPSGTSDKLVWQIVRKRPLTLVSTPAEAGSFTVNDTPVAAGTVWLAEQPSVTVSPVPAYGYDFLWWGGSHLGDKSTSVTVPFDTGVPVTLEALFQSNGEGHDPVTIGTKGVSGSWMNAATWAQGAVPQYGDTVLVTNGSLTLDLPLPRLAKLVVSNATLTVSNWMTRVYADKIQVGPGGVIRTVGGIFDGEMSNRVWLVGQDLTVSGNGTISADDAGYSCNSGPCWASVKARIAAGDTSANISRDACGVYGSAYTAQPVSSPPDSYGSAEFPSDPGSGCGELAYYVARQRGIGGGAIRLDFTGDVRIDGKVSASVSLTSTSGTNNQRGSGGSVWISCRTIAGNGRVAADGGEPLYFGYLMCGGGGRVAVHYDTTAQDAEGCNIVFSAAGGMASDQLGTRTIVPGETLLHNAYARSGEDWAFVADGGTLWFSDNRFLTSANYLAKGLPFTGHWTSSVALAKLELNGPAVLTNAFLQLPSGTAVEVKGDLSIGGSGYFARRNTGIAFDSSAVKVTGNLNVIGARVELRGGSLTVDGDVTETALAGASRYQGGELAIKAGTADDLGYGAYLNVAGTLQVSANCYVCPFAEPTTGSLVKMFAKNVILAKGGRIDADEKGWQKNFGPGAPSAYAIGASHAGVGGSNAASPVIPTVYGKERRPYELGSGGMAIHANAGFDGGGLVDLEIEGTFVLNGIVSADGSTRMTAGYASASSGGSVIIRTHRLQGTTGQIRAQGGCCAAAKEAASAYGATGGGGRIAVWAGVNEWTDEMRASNVTVAPGCENGVPANTFGATAGTVYWGQIGGFKILVR